MWQVVNSSPEQCFKSYPVQRNLKYLSSSMFDGPHWLRFRLKTFQQHTNSSKFGTPRSDFWNTQRNSQYNKLNKEDNKIKMGVR